MKRLLIIALGIAVIAALPVAAQQFGQVGTSGAQLLKINPDPRASGLGFAAGSAVDNAAAVFTNIAGISNVTWMDATAGYTMWFADISIASAALAMRVGGVGVVSVSVMGFREEEEITTPTMENGTGIMYSMFNYAFGIGFARDITDKLSMGFQAKLVREEYYGKGTTGIAFDVGSRYDLGFAGSRLSLVLQNFGPDLQPLTGSYQDYSDSFLEKKFTGAPLPVTFRASFSSVPLSGEAYSVRVVADLIHPNDNVEHYNVGAEASLRGIVMLRAGLKLNYDDELFAFGIGFLGGQVFGQNIRLDYSFEQFDILPNVQKLSVGFTF